MTEVEEHNAALEKVTDFVEEKELNEDETKQLSTALSSLADPARAVLSGEESRYVTRIPKHSKSSPGSLLWWYHHQELKNIYVSYLEGNQGAPHRARQLRQICPIH